MLPDFHLIADTTQHSAVASRIRRGATLAVVLAVAALPASAQDTGNLLTSREELTSAIARAENAGNAVQAGALRQRLRDGDFQVGERIVLTVVSDAAHTDTLLVRAGRFIDLPGNVELPLTGVLRSEIASRVTTEILKYVKASSVEVVPLTRIAVLGEVVRPGYFALRSDVPITDAIMIAGGPTTSADIDQTVVKRANREYRSVNETRHAIANGLTIDQLGLSAGDVVLVGRQRTLISQSVLSVLGMAATLGAVVVAIRR
jgi:hypothetical protein